MPARLTPAAASRSRASRSVQGRRLASATADFKSACLAMTVALGLDEPSRGTLDFIEVMAAGMELHIRKVRGYGRANDSWANFRRAENMGMDPVHGVLLRMGDKMSRLENLAADESNELLGEGIDKEAEDMAGYANIVRCLLKERARAS